MAPRKNGSGRSKRGWLHFRTDSEMLDRLDAIVEQLAREDDVHTTRSALVRVIIADHLDEPQKVATTKEVLANVWNVTQHAVAQLTHDLKAKLPGYVESGMEELRR